MLKKIKGSKTLFYLSIIMILSSVIEIIFGDYVLSNIINLVLWSFTLICSIKGW